MLPRWRAEGPLIGLPRGIKIPSAAELFRGCLSAVTALAGPWWVWAGDRDTGLGEDDQNGFLWLKLSQEPRASTDSPTPGPRGQDCHLAGPAPVPTLPTA